jgi:hypothetical protein
MSEFRDFCEALPDDNSRLLAEVWKWIDDNYPLARSDKRLAEIYASIAERLNIR